MATSFVGHLAKFNKEGTEMQSCQVIWNERKKILILDFSGLDLIAGFQSCKVNSWQNVFCFRTTFKLKNILCAYPLQLKIHPGFGLWSACSQVCIFSRDVFHGFFQHA